MYITLQLGSSVFIRDCKQDNFPNHFTYSLRKQPPSNPPSLPLDQKMKSAILALIAIVWIKLASFTLSLPGQSPYSISNAKTPDGIKQPPANWNPFPNGLPTDESAFQPFEAILEPLPYQYHELEPVIDRETMEIHYSKHHQAYATNYNRIMKGLRSDPRFPSYLSLGFIGQLRKLPQFPGDVRTGIRNNLGGFVNHLMFWPTLRPPVYDNRPGPDNVLGKALISQYGSFENFQKQFSDQALSLFGSGWTWFVIDCDAAPISGGYQPGFILNLPNQDFPQTGVPVMLLDLFEHAYYIQYRNRRDIYVKNMWQLYNWTYLEEHYVNACPGFQNQNNSDLWEKKMEEQHAEAVKKAQAEAAGLP